MAEWKVTGTATTEDGELIRWKTFVNCANRSHAVIRGWADMKVQFVGEALSPVRGTWRADLVSSDGHRADSD